VLVVDEAGMLGTRQLARLLEATDDAQAKLVLVGDHRQLPELAAGGTFRALARELAAVRLTENHRQEHIWERDALDDLRHGDVDRALETYEQHGRIAFATDATVQREALVGAWWDAVSEDAGGRERSAQAVPVILAARRVDIEELNRQARERMARAGQLRGPPLRVNITDRDHRDYQVGDVVIARRNAYLDGLVNGQRGVITHVDLEAGTVEVSAGPSQITVPSTYLRGGALEYGYALTVHQAQGLTTNRTFLLGDSALYREISYVGLSRAKQRAELHLTSRPDQFNEDQDSCGREREGLPGDALDHAKRALGQSRAQHTAHDLSSRPTRRRHTTNRTAAPPAQAAPAAPDRRIEPWLPVVAVSQHARRERGCDQGARAGPVAWASWRDLTRGVLDPTRKPALPLCIVARPRGRRAVESPVWRRGSWSTTKPEILPTH
jgi:hypothetical protein